MIDEIRAADKEGIPFTFTVGSVCNSDFWLWLFLGSVAHTATTIVEVDVCALLSAKRCSGFVSVMCWDLELFVHSGKLKTKGSDFQGIVLSRYLLWHPSHPQPRSTATDMLHE